MNYKIRIQCFKATPYERNDQLFLTMDQIIPTKEVEDYMIRIAEKTQDDIDNKTELKNRHIIRQKFWGELLQSMNLKSKLFQNISAGKYNWIGAGSGVRGISYNFGVSKNYGRAELYIDFLIHSKLKIGEINQNEYDEVVEILDKKLEEMWERLDGSYQIDSGK
ncbi:DUF4268 domain-containing protein [Desulfobacula sp.]|uniref:DUF4268 domain-containing protein n=1 Tax=Desulfobacula sp. TaxID=2593537 RepID=UPI0039B8FAD2